MKTNDIKQSNEVVIVYKKIRVGKKDSRLYPLFIDAKRPFELGHWMHCEFHPKKGFMSRSLGKDQNGNEIGGWHACFQPVAPHLADELSNGEKRVWMKCEAKGRNATYDRPESQGGQWCLYEWIRPIEIINY